MTHKIQLWKHSRFVQLLTEAAEAEETTLFFCKVSPLHSLPFFLLLSCECSIAVDMYMLLGIFQSWLYCCCADWADHAGCRCAA